MKKNAAILILLVVASVLTLSCGSQTTSSDTAGQPQPIYSESAGISFALRWPDPQVADEPDGMARAAAAGVATVRISMSASDMTTISQDFPASAGTGSVGNVTPGANRTITFQGINASNVVTHEGTKTGVTLVAGQTYNCGIVNMIYVGVVTTNTPNRSSASFSIGWDVIDGGASTGNSASYSAPAAVKGQSDGIGFSSSANFRNHAGFSTTAEDAPTP